MCGSDCQLTQHDILFWINPDGSKQRRADFGPALVVNAVILVEMELPAAALALHRIEKILGAHVTSATKRVFLILICGLWRHCD